MMIANNLKPNYVTHPGEVIKDELEYLKIPQKRFAEQIGLSASLVNQVLKGKRPVNTEFALLTEAAIDIPADLLLRMQARYDRWKTEQKPGFMEKLGEDDIVMITADHGCDPGDLSTDHTRENVPLLVYGKNVEPVDLGVRKTFADIAATVAEMLDVEFATPGESFAKEVQV